MSAFFQWIGDLIHSCFNALVNFLFEIFNVFYTAACAVGQFYLDFFDYIWQWIVWAFYLALDFFLVQGIAFSHFTFDNFDFIDFNTIVSLYQTIKAVLSVANNFVPLDTFFFCLAIYISVLLVWIVYRFIKSWIPTLSG
ncbi:MAG: hypothetical protein Q4D38_05135 [Planctomycetia bacterium]|nr:hypothetical protein [Planctomycetia bacterium]